MAVPNPMTRLPVLRTVPIFRGLSRANLLQVARRVTEVSYPAGAILVRQGDPGDSLCVIASGTVEVRRDERAMAQMTTGQYFGEISLIDGEPRSATVVAIDDVVLLRLSSEDFDSLLTNRYVAHAVMKNLARLFREAQESLGPNNL